MTRPRLLLVLVAVVGGVAAPGCGSDAEAPTPKASAAPQSTVAIEGFKFVPEDVTVDVGTTITWTNGDAAPHTATADDGSFDTGDLRKGDAGKTTFRNAGSFAYFCEFHKFMRAKITVR